MAKTDELPPGFRDGLADHLTRFMSAENHSLPSGSLAQIWIGEAFQVWSVSLAELRNGAPLQLRARRTCVWHLQLRATADGPAVAFARCLLLNGGSELRSVHFSPLAGEIDTAVQWIDENLPDDSWVVRFLEISDLQLPMLWLSNGQEDRFRILLSREDRSRRGFRAEPLYSEAELLDRLSEVSPIPILSGGA